ncbi:MAG TPA: histidine kinase dimerization/phospho-acceptor domain-containing protein, partial [Herpetosiphonaceae bacterium]|nr:histidine kinase dimerization/phospho-acceptor domain-containing protein [Herpetosiphonaceae bacterium]
DGFSLRAAEAVGQAGDAEVVLTLAALVNKSMLVQQELPDGAIRFRLLETVRDFALELLDQAGAAEDARRRHAAFYAGLSGELKSGAALELLGGDQANLGAALHWALERGAARLAIQLAEITWTLQRHMSAALASSRASAQALESQVAERTADLQAALAQVEERERRLTALNAELLEARAAAEEADYLKTRLLANLSHEFHTILNVIINFTSFLGDPEYGALNRRQRFFQRRLEANAEYLLDLINDIMDFSQVEIGALELSLEDVDLAALAREIVPAAAGFTRDKGLIVQVAAEDGLPGARGDRRWMRQIFLNLLWYLTRLTSQPGLRVRLWSEGDGMVRCSIGEGGQRPRAADLAAAPAGLAPASFSDGELRLAISRAFVRLHGGEIAVVGAAGQGLAVVFALPAASPGPGSAGRS